jgi:choline dehydrogenase-like flavoprotein
VIIDFRDVAPDTEIASDVCILGAGAAGITLACSLSRAGRDVVLIESGGFQMDTPTQDLYAGTSIGQHYPYPGTFCRVRYFGGSTNWWNGLCGPLDPQDFEVRPWIPYSGWPIGRSDLDPYYVRAHEWAELGPFAYDTADWTTGERRFHALLPSKLTHCFWQFSPPTRFGQVYRDELAAAENVRVYLFANAVDIELESGARAVRRVHLRTLTGGRGTVRARRVVLALGGIENPRLLLSSDGVQGTGVGNGRDLVGRFFMEHPHARCAHVLPRDPEALVFPAFVGGRNADDPIVTDFYQDGVHVRAGLTSSPLAQRREGILNAAIGMRMEDRFTGFDALRSVTDDLRHRRWPDSFARNVWLMIREFGETARGVRSRLARRQYRPPRGITLFSMLEQAPNPDSRITLDRERDALGMRRVKLDWQLSPMEKRTLRRTLMLVGEEVGRLGLGRLRLFDWLQEGDDADWPSGILYGGCHHMGTTRMATDPSRGVVDAHCRVHGISNLYIAGSSVFPTVGFMNPTLTIVALALRLADHLSTD